MNRKLSFLLIGAMLLLASVSCSASPPVANADHVPTIKQTATVETSIYFQITNPYSGTEMVYVENLSFETIFLNTPKVHENFISCANSKTTKSIDVVLITWQNGNYEKNMYNKRIRNLGFHYTEGIATEYSVS